MARIRTIKPEFFRHEELYQAEKESKLPLRVAFAGLWTVADREGRFRWKPTQIKLDVLPYDECNMIDVLNTLVKYGFVNKYQDNKEDYGFIPSFKNHQVVNIREAKSKLPSPCGDDETVVPVIKTDSRLDKNITPKVRHEIYLRDGYRCLRCGSEEDLTIDHIFPQSCGGTHAKTNLRTLCRSCNSARPVQGDALDKDLALDGFTWNDMQRICGNVHAHGELEKEGKGREHIQIASAVCEIFGKEYLAPEERLPAQANWYRTIDDQTKRLSQVWSAQEAIKQVRAYIKHCKDTQRKMIATDYKVAEILLSVDWVKINNPSPATRDGPFSEAEYNKTIWTDTAWREKYSKQIRKDKAFQDHFKLTTQ